MTYRLSGIQHWNHTVLEGLRGSCKIPSDVAQPSGLSAVAFWSRRCFTGHGLGPRKRLLKNYLVRLPDHECRVCDETVDKLVGSSQEVHRTRIPRSVDATGPNWTGWQVASTFRCRIGALAEVLAEIEAWSTGINA